MAIKPNAARRNRAYGAIRFHVLRSGLDPATVSLDAAIAGLITDARLLAIQNGKDFPAILKTARETAAALLETPDKVTRNPHRITDDALAVFVRTGCNCGDDTDDQDDQNEDA